MTTKTNDLKSKNGKSKKAWPENAAPGEAHEPSLPDQAAERPNIPPADLPGVVPEPTTAQHAAMTLVDSRERLDVLKERVRQHEQDLVVAMHQDQVSIVRVRDGVGNLHLFELETLEKVKHRSI